MADDRTNVFNRTNKRLKNILRWLLAGQFRQLFRAIVDQFLIKTTGLRRFLIKYDVFRKGRERRRLKEMLAARFGVTEPDGQGLQVALIVRDGTSSPKSSAFIRLITPLTHPSLRGKLSIRLYDENTTAVEDGTAVCIVQRTAYDNETTAARFIEHVKARGMALILDSDDAFHDIDETHPEHAAHAARVAALNLITQNADQVWLSVPALKPAYVSAKGKVVVVPNSLDERLWGRYKAEGGPRDGKLQLVYMGTATHDADLKIILPVLDKLDVGFPGSFTLTLIGVADQVAEKPWIARLYQPKYGSINPNFVQWFRAQGPFDAGLSPLVDSEFNRCKSDIKCLDYLAAGIRPVVSDCEPYRPTELSPFIIKVKNNERGWEAALADIIKDPAAFRARSAKLMPEAQNYIWHKRSSEQTAKRLFELIEASLEPKN